MIISFRRIPTQRLEFSGCDKVCDYYARKARIVQETSVSQIYYYQPAIRTEIMRNSLEYA